MIKTSSVIIGIVLLVAPGAIGQDPTASSLSKPQTLKPFNGASIKIRNVEGREVFQSEPNVGAGDRGSFLEGVDFSEGTIEIDIRGSGKPASSFVGVVFRALDGKNYEAVYFRPFNFGHQNSVRRGHSVQYICHPQWSWKKLRQTRPGDFENRVTPEPRGDEWFHVRIDVTGDRIRVFVNDSQMPSLDVESLGTNQKGKVGLWFNGIASFANLKITPKK